jgi:peptidoglycan/LPS O-acetylase OafA/YrhL
MSGPTWLTRPGNLKQRLRSFFLLGDNGSRNQAMEGLRGYAVFLVFLVHGIATCCRFLLNCECGQYTGVPLAELLQELGLVGVALQAVQRCHYGVDLFFLLSGFLIFRIVDRQGREFAYLPYLGKRALRIYPAFLISLLFGAWGFCRYGYVPFYLRDFALNLLFLNGSPWPVMPYNYVTWSLFYEFLFYLVFPLFYLALRRSRQDGAAWQVLGVPLLFGLAGLATAWLNHFTLFFFGALLGMQSDEQLQRAARALPTALVLLVYGLAVATFHWSLHAPFGYFLPLYGIACSLLFVKACYDRGPLHSVCAWVPLRWLGNISYSFYLIHAVVTAWVAHRIARSLLAWPEVVSFPVLLVAMFAASLVASVLLFTVAERWYFWLMRAPAKPQPVAKAPGRYAARAAQPSDSRPYAGSHRFSSLKPPYNGV